MKVVVIGGTGLLGSALVTAARARGWTAVAIGSRGGDAVVDLRDLAALEALLDREAPDMLVNAAALVNLAACEADPGEAWAVNARPVGVMAAWTRRRDRRFVHISTDHFFQGDGDRAHDEDAPVSLVNEYARTKFAAETFARTDPASIVVRTTFVGASVKPGRATFLDWIVGALDRGEAITLFADAHFSPIAVDTLVEVVLDLAATSATGVLNVAGREVISKADFIREIAARRGQSLDGAKIGSVASLSPRRGDSLGLDVRRAEEHLGRALPDVEATLRRLPLADPAGER